MCRRNRFKRAAYTTATGLWLVSCMVFGAIIVVPAAAGAMLLWAAATIYDALRPRGARE